MADSGLEINFVGLVYEEAVPDLKFAVMVLDINLPSVDVKVDVDPAPPSNFNIQIID